MFSWKIDDEIFIPKFTLSVSLPPSHSWLEFSEWNTESKVLCNSARCFDRTCFANEFGDVYSVCDPQFGRPHCCRKLWHSRRTELRWDSSSDRKNTRKNTTNTSSGVPSFSIDLVRLHVVWNVYIKQRWQIFTIGISCQLLFTHMT